MNRFLILVTVLMLSAGSVWAQEAHEDGIWARWKAKAQVTWVELKTKAQAYWEKWRAEDNRTPSSEPAAVQNTASDQSVTPQQPATAPVPEVTELKQIAQQVKAAQPFAISKAARTGDASLAKTRSGVPVFNMESEVKTKKGIKRIAVKTIPLLDIGEEAHVSRTDWALTSPQISKLDVVPTKALPSPGVYPHKQIQALVMKPFEKAKIQAKLETIRLALPEGINLELVQKINYSLASELVVQEVPFKEFSEDQMNLLKGLILAEYQKKCHLAVGLLNALPEKMASEEMQLKDYHRAACLHEMGFFSDSIDALISVMKKGVPQYATLAIETLSKDIPREYVKEVGAAFKTVDESLVTEKAKNGFFYYIALSESMKRKYESSLAYAVKVKEESPKYPEAQYLAVVAEYMLDRVNDSVARQERILKALPKYKVDAPIQALIKLNLGRIAYRQKDYKRAIESYQFIDKDSPMWIQALTEQGWMQILAKDALGAIGNMHSLHSPFFNAIYKPESYVVRTIGYINICQYGDAYRSLTYLENFYKPWLTTMESFRKSNSANKAYYDYVIGNLKSKAKETDGRLPMTIIKEVGRQKDFVNLQSAINNAFDQGVQYGFIKDLVRKEQRKVDSKIAQVKTRISDLSMRIEGAKKKVDDRKFVEEWKRSRDFEREMQSFYEFEKITYAQSLGDFGKFEGASKISLGKWTSRLKDLAGERLKMHLTKTEKQLAKILENNEFLRYEVYAGSGENIRYISAAGSTEPRRMPVSAEPRDTKQKWSFDGEFWADEIGHYRSSLKDNCPQAVTANSKVN